MPSRIPTHFPPDFDTFMLPAAALATTAQEAGVRPVNASLLRLHQEHGPAAPSHPAQADWHSAEASRPGAWSQEPAELPYRELPATADPRLSAIACLDLGPSGYTWARQELDVMESNHTPQAGQQYAAALPYWQVQSNLLQEAIVAARQQAPGANAAAAAAPMPDMPDMPGLIRLHLLLEELDATPSANAAAAPLVAAPAPDAPRMPDSPLTLEEVQLEDGAELPEAPEAPVTPLAELLSVLAFATITGLQPVNDCSVL